MTHEEISKHSGYDYYGVNITVLIDENTWQPYIVLRCDNQKTHIPTTYIDLNVNFPVVKELIDDKIKPILRRKKINKLINE